MIIEGIVWIMITTVSSMSSLSALLNHVNIFIFLSIYVFFQNMLSQDSICTSFDWARMKWLTQLYFWQSSVSKFMDVIFIVIENKSLLAIITDTCNISSKEKFA